MRARTIALPLVFCLVGSGVLFAADAQIGTWKLNEAKSTFSAGAARNSIVVYQAAGRPNRRLCKFDRKTPIEYSLLASKILDHPNVIGRGPFQERKMAAIRRRYGPSLEDAVLLPERLDVAFQIDIKKR
jgi:hypothetical protein